ncbi:FMN-binding negative transcriptional regulator [Streptomyces sp. NBC_01116]|uniref:FMN-binding negative transcriptional regulator n=1 Tax=Streptomyces sp. NBC_01116 TaxID=2903752 RepID=UPI003251DD59
MFIQPWGAALDDAKWQTWIAEGHDFGILSVNGPPGHAPAVVPTHSTVDGTALLVHLARPNPVWKAIETDPNVTFTITGDYAFIPGPWRAKPGAEHTDGVPTSYYAAVQSPARPASSTTRRPRRSCCAGRWPTSSPMATTPPIDPAQPPYGRMLPGIRGLPLDVADVRAKFTYDHRTVEQRTGTARRLTERGTTPDAPTAAQQLRRLDRAGTWKS